MKKIGEFSMVNFGIREGNVVPYMFLHYLALSLPRKV